MTRILFVSENGEPFPLPESLCSEASSEDICVSFESEAAFSDSIRTLPPRGTLAVTDSDRTVLSCLAAKLPVVGYEHDGRRLSAPEIIQSLAELTVGDYRELYDALTGQSVYYQTNRFLFRGIPEEEFVEVYHMLSESPYGLAETDCDMSDSQIREMYKTRRTVSGMIGGFGPACLIDKAKNNLRIGYAAAYPEQLPADSSEAGSGLFLEYAVYPELRGLGHGTMLVSALCDTLRALFPGETLYARVHPDNTPSAAILKKLGFLPLPPNLYYLPKFR